MDLNLDEVKYNIFVVFVSLGVVGSGFLAGKFKLINVVGGGKQLFRPLVSWQLVGDGGEGDKLGV